MPIRIQRKRTKGFRLPENTKSVARPGFFGNPFKVGNEDNKLVIGLYEDWLKNTPEGTLTIKKAKAELKGKNLACFCPLDKPCHADILLKIANQ